MKQTILEAKLTAWIQNGGEPLPEEVSVKFPIRLLMDHYYNDEFRELIQELLVLTCPENVR